MSKLRKHDWPLRTDGEAVTARLLDVSQAAVYLGRTAKAVSLMIDRHQLPVIRAGRKCKRFLDRRDLDVIIDRQRGF